MKPALTVEVRGELKKVVSAIYQKYEAWPGLTTAERIEAAAVDGYLAGIDPGFRARILQQDDREVQA